ncbi:MAG: MinD/ParA family protein [Cellvibrionaceae bacterium]|nr:MinD/ParA family protein [Cellvibrionaceae bacterium]
MSHPVQVIAVTGGKGGVGKSNIAVNLSVALAQMQRRVVLMDADLGLANIDVLLGIKPTKTIADVLSGECDLRDILVQGPSGIRIVPAASGVQQMSTLTPQQHGALIHGFSVLSEQLDVLVIDTAAGISDTVINFVCAAQEVVIVVLDEPSSVTDAYALIKLLNKEYNIQRVRVIANMVRNAKEGQVLFKKLSLVCERFLDISMQYVGAVPIDENVRKAVQKQKALLEYAPQSKASQAMRQLATKVNSWPITSSPSGHLEFFVERLLQTQASAAEVHYGSS